MISYPQDAHRRCRQLEDASFWFRHRNRCLLAALGRFPPPGRLYDVGGGNGVVAAALERAGLEVTLVEPGQAGADNARARGVSVVLCATLADAGLPAGSLPAIGIFDVLEHIADDAGFLVSLRQMLRSDGWLYVTVPAYSAMWSVDDELAGHHRRYTRGRLSRDLSRAGFQVAYATYLFWLLPAPIFAFRAVPSRLGLRRDRDAARGRREHGVGDGDDGSGGRVGRRLGARIGARLRGGFIDRALCWEPAAIAAGRTIPIGGSVLAVARKS